MKPKIDPQFLVDSAGKKIGVQLKIEDYELLMKLLEPLEGPRQKKSAYEKVDTELVDKGPKKSKLIFRKTEAELDFEKSEGISGNPEGEEVETAPNNFYTRSIITHPVKFEMIDEFCSAEGILMADGKNFKVLAGSKASGIIDRALPGKTRYIREELEMLRVIEDDEKHGDMVFTRDYEFDNPHDAASVIAGSPRDGSHCWIAVENGKPMRQY